MVDDNELVEIRAWLTVDGDKPDLIIGLLPRKRATELACDLCETVERAGYERVVLSPPQVVLPPPSPSQWQKCEYEDLKVGDSVLLLLPGDEGGTWLHHRVHRIGYDQTIDGGERLAWVDFIRERWEGPSFERGLSKYRVYVDHPRGLSRHR